MRAAHAALHQGIGTHDAWMKASVDYYLAQHPEDSIWRWTGPEAGIPSIEQIRDRAAVADRANKALPRDGRIDPDPERHDTWSAQLGWAHETLGAVITDGFLEAVAALKTGDPSGLEYGVRFLEADPWCHRSGYWKERLIPKIVQFELDETMRQRLARVVLAVVDDPRRRREIRKYGTLACAVVIEDLRARLEQRATADDLQVRFNAGQVLERLS